ncbi:hypothetical protein [Alcaligenes sp. SDU_A2]|uniref:hypothetical protein n=1 Tax=Alcaligenes sp. SDU_A2 TaxID=3136634 RepID=UPI00312038DF
MDTNRNNLNFKKLRAAMLLRTDDIVAICRHGGYQASRSIAQRWGLSQDAGPGRYAVMTDEAFDAFCGGLRTWLIEQETNDDK